MKYNGLSLREKADRVAREITKAKNNLRIQEIASRLQTPDRMFSYLKENVRYQTESGDRLYDPVTSLERGVADCEDQTLLMGAMAAAQGYPVWIRIIRNGTNHIYPLVYVSGEWRNYDPTPQDAVTGEYVDKNYEIYTEGLVTETGLKRPKNSDTGAVDTQSFFSRVAKGIPNGLGIGLGTALATWLVQRYVVSNFKK